MRTRLLICAGLIVLNLVVYAQTTGFDFAFDDRYYVDENERVAAGLTSDNFVWAWTTTYFVNWHPLTWLSYMLDVQLYGPKPGGFHVTNLIWHTANSLLLFVVLRRLTGTLWESAFVAALFAVHPLHVESVAWISGRKDLISTFFGLAAIDAYVRSMRRQDWRWYSISLAAFAVSLCAKQMLVTLSCLLLLLDIWPLGRTRLWNGKAGRAADASSAGDAPIDGNAAPVEQAWSRLVLEKLPFFLLGAVFSAVVIVAQSGGGAVRDLEEFALATRICNALVAYVLYLKMMFWPAGLCVFYPHPGASLSWSSAAAAAAVLVVLSGVCLFQFRRRPYLLVGWLWYLGTLVPVIGLVQVGSQQMADRYTYIPLIGPFLSVTWLAWSIVGHSVRRPILPAALAGTILLVLTAVAWRQTGFWQNNVVLFEHALAVTQDNKIAHNNLGYALEKNGRLAEAYEEYQQALRLDPNYAFAHLNLGTLFLKQDRVDDAVTHYREVVRLMPAHQTAHYNLGVCLEKLGRFDEAELHYRNAADQSDAQYNLAVLLERQGRQQEAIEQYRRALRLDPKLIEAHFNLANTLAQQGQMAEATHHYRLAVHIDPAFAAAHYNLSLALTELGELEAAVEHALQCLRADPQNVLAHNQLGKLYASMEGRQQLAVEHFRQALALDPDFDEAKENLRRALEGQLESSLKPLHEPVSQ